MAKTTKNKRRAPKKTLPIAPLLGMGTLALWSYDGWRAGGLNSGMNRLLLGLTGYDRADGTVKPKYMRHGTLPIILGLLAHKAAGSLGFNRALGRAGVPYIRI